MDEEIKKQMSSTNKKQKIFNVRKLNYKQQYQPSDKYYKPHFSPFQVKDNIYQPATQKVSKKTAEYNFHLAIVSSVPYKELNRRYQVVREEQVREKERRLQELREKEEQLVKYQAQRERLGLQRQRLSKRRDQLKQKLSQIQSKNQQLRAQQLRRTEQYRIINMQYLRNMLISMRYQNGIDIDIDNMSYQQLLQLEEKMGSVSKGLSKEQYDKLERKVAGPQKEGDGLCSICYEQVGEGEEIVGLPCGHWFHGGCIKEWLGKEKVCPLCKQEIVVKV